MIFVTVGHQSPFDRLVRLMDSWASDSDIEVFGQIGKAKYRPQHMRAVAFLSVDDFNRNLEDCTSVVAHAGTGTIIQGLMRQKPMLVVPRLASNGETRNDHQVSTAKYFEDSGHVLAAYDQTQFFRRMDDIASFRPTRGLSGKASEQLITRLRHFVTETVSPEASASVTPN